MRRVESGIEAVSKEGGEIERDTEAGRGRVGRRRGGEEVTKGEEEEVVTGAVTRRPEGHTTEGAETRGEEGTETTGRGEATTVGREGR